MAVPIRVPDLGTNVEEILLVQWLVEEGDTLRVGDPIAQVETDKAVMEMESPVGGVLLRRVVPDDTVVRSGDVLAYAGEAGEEPPLGDGAGPGRGGEASAASVSATERTGAGSRAQPDSTERPAPIAAQPDAPPSLPLTPVAGPRVPVAGLSEALDDDPALLLALYRQMLLIRQFEERVKQLFLEGVMPGTIHQYQGQEAVAVGVCSVLRPDDVITSTHRPHGHALAKGLSPESLLHELFGKRTGCCRGKGGSMHVGDLEKGMVPAVAIVGGGVPIATGIGLAFRMTRQSRVAVCFMGDGAVNQGAFHEGVNMGAIWSLPVVYVIENNLYSASTPIRQMVRVARLSDRAAAYGIPGVTVDGNDVEAVRAAAREAVARARSGEGPTLLEAVTYRITGHSRRDPCHYQPEEERRRALEDEPIRRFAALLLRRGVADQEALEAERAEVEAQIEGAVRSAMAAPDPAPEEALEGLFA